MVHAGRELPDFPLRQPGEIKQQFRSAYYIFLSHKYKVAYQASGVSGKDIIFPMKLFRMPLETTARPIPLYSVV